MKKHIPNFITLINLFCGCCALVNVCYGNFVAAFWFLFAGGWADYLDGAVARMLDVHSPLGKELDSLADMVSFGVVPGAMCYMLLVKGSAAPEEMSGLTLRAAPGFALTVFAGLRLAKFNIDTRQEDHFIGLPTPSCTVFVTGMALIYHFNSYGLANLVSNPWFVYGMVAVLSFLLVSEIPMFNLKFKSFQWKGNEIKIIFTVISLAMVVALREAAFSAVVLLYILVTGGQYLIAKMQSRTVS